MTGSLATHAYVPPFEPEVDAFNPPLLNDANVATFREYYGVRTHDDLHRAIATSNVLATAHNALLDPMFDPVDYRDVLDGLGMAIDTLIDIVTPTEEALSGFFIENWIFDIIDGECRARYSPLTDADTREHREEES